MCCRLFDRISRLKILRQFRPFFQKMLTLLDISTDIRMTTKMYHVNPYWYMTMLFSLVSPFLVYWSSHHHFERITHLLGRIQKGSGHAKSETFTKNYCVSGIVSSYLVALSLPVIGLILTILEVVSMYAFQLAFPILAKFGVQNCYLCRCILDIQDSLQSKEANQFFVISELFFESVPQLVLQIWIYSRYADTFTDSNGVPYITSGDIWLSISAALANIIMNISMLANEAKRLGLTLELYIPYFIGAKTNNVLTEAVPINNWFHTKKRRCNLSNIPDFYDSHLLKSSIHSIHRVLNQYNEDTLRNYFKLSTKTLILPGDFIENTVMCTVTPLEISRFTYQCRHLSENFNVHISIKLFQTSEIEVYSFPIQNNKNLHICHAGEQAPSCFSIERFSMDRMFLKEYDEDLDFQRHCDLIQHGFQSRNLYCYQGKLVPYLIILGLTGKTKTIHRVAHYLDILITGEYKCTKDRVFSRHRRYIQYIVEILRELIRDRYNSTRLQIEASNFKELKLVRNLVCSLTEDSYLSGLISKNPIELCLQSIHSCENDAVPLLHIPIVLDFHEDKYAYSIKLPEKIASHRRRTKSVFQNKQLMNNQDGDDIQSDTQENGETNLPNGYLLVHYSDSQEHFLEIRNIPQDSSLMTFWRIIPTQQLGEYQIISCCGKFHLYLDSKGDLDIQINRKNLKPSKFTFLEKI